MYVQLDALERSILNQRFKAALERIASLVRRSRPAAAETNGQRATRNQMRGRP